MLSRYSNIPQPFFLEDAVITHPTEGDSAGSNRGVGAYVLRLQVPDHKANTYIENNMKKRDLDDIRLEEHQIHIYDKTEKAFLKQSEEGLNGAGSLKKEFLVE